MKTERRKANGIDIHFVTDGHGPAVLLLHGWPQTSYEWRHLVPALAADFTVVAPDLRGLGATSRPETGYDKRTIARDVRALVRELGLGPVRIVGHDWGGVVGYLYAAESRDEVERLAVLDVVLPTKQLEGMPLLMRGRHHPAWHFAFHNVPGLAETVLAGCEEPYLRWWFQTGAARPDAVADEDIAEYARAYSQPGAMRAGFEYYRAVFQDIDDVTELSRRKLSVPVLAVGGAHTFGAMVEQSLREVAENVRGVVLEGCGHWITEEMPHALSAILVEFMRAGP